MLLNRTSFAAAIGLLVILATAPAFGQGPQGFQLFSQADVSTFGGQERPNEGYFFQFDANYWGISPPKVHLVGEAGTNTVNIGPSNDSVIIQHSTVDTSPFTEQFTVGDRFEFGRLEDANGWFVSIYQVRDQAQTFTVPEADMVFNDLQQGPNGHKLLFGNVASTGPTVEALLPVIFDHVSLEDDVDTWGVEASYLHRFMTGHHGGTFELFLGARYIEFNDHFHFKSGTSDAAVGDPNYSYLQESTWDSTAENHIVGPQVGLRWFKKEGRWMFNAEGRFMPGINCQNLLQVVDMGPTLSPNPGLNASPPVFQPLVLGHTATTNTLFIHEFSPVVEIRIEGRYQITQAISFHAGWTGVYMDNIARGSSIISYNIPNLGIDTTRNREDMFMNGVTIGFDINR